jgi:hypothetical protein
VVYDLVVEGALKCSILFVFLKLVYLVIPTCMLDLTPGFRDLVIEAMVSVLIELSVRACNSQYQTALCSVS